MLKRLVASVGLLVLATAGSAAAQARAEVGANIGWNFSDGVEGDPILAGDGNVYDRVDPKDSATFGFNIGFHVTPNAEVGFMYGYQASKLVVGGTNEVELGDLGITTYHGYFAYNFGEEDAPTRPFVFGGLGATSFGSVDYTVGRGGTISGETQFSTTWGGGVKFFPAPGFGVRVAAQFTPTYIKSDAAGWWCDPYWGCYLVGDAQYSNQFGFNAGIVFRF